MAEPIVNALRAHERGLQLAHTGEVFDARMRTTIATHRRGSLAWAWSVAAGLVLIGLGLALFRVYAPMLEAGDEPPQAVSRLAGGAAEAGQACRRDFAGKTIELDGRCKLEIEGPGVTIETWTRARVEPRADGLVVHDGLVLIEVRKVRPGAPPVQVGVEGGTIEVLGTQFVVYQGGAGGEVELMEGAIRFARTDGDTVEMRVGDRLRWTPVADEEPVEPSAPLEPRPPDAAGASRPAPPTVRREPDRAQRAPEAAPKPILDLNATLAEVARLREARRFDAALEQIRALRREAGLPNGVVELLSFEQGTLLEAKRATDAACQHWARHASRFPAGRYASEVSRHRESLACPDGEGGRN